MLRLRVVVALTAAVTVGCGGASADSAQQQTVEGVRAALTAQYKAFLNGDYAAYCQAMNASSQSTFGYGKASACPETIAGMAGKLGAQEDSVKQNVDRVPISISGTTATVTPVNGYLGPQSLEWDGTSWKVSG